MRDIALYLCFSIAILSSLFCQAQDVMMQGCYWSCPEDDPNSPIDSASLDYWIERMQKQAPELAHAGFTYLWIPSVQSAPSGKFRTFVNDLNNQGISPVAGLSVGIDSMPSFYQQASLLHDNYAITAYSISSQEVISPQLTAQAINRLHREERPPNLMIAEIPYNQQKEELSKWAGQVAASLDFQAEAEAQPRVYDVMLREALRKACTDEQYDARLIFEQSVRDASSLSGFNVVTFINHPAYKNQNGIDGDHDDIILFPLLAYTYLLTNNQIGLPSIFYGDYFGSASEVQEYQDLPPLKAAIDQLIKVHQDFIFGSTSVEYLNKRNSDKKQIDLLSGTGADSTQFLLFQLDGNNTPAGKQHTPPGNQDVIVAINFSYDTLMIKQEINISNVQEKTIFTDVIGEALTPEIAVTPFDSSGDIRNAVTIGLAPGSYAVWVQGQTSAIVPSRIDLSTQGQDDYIEISWETAYETGTYGYELERSVNGHLFEKIASFKALSQSEDPASYLHFDKDVFPNEQLYYRVKLLDTEGGYEYSPVETATLFRRDLSFDLIDERGNDIKILLINSNAPAVANLELISAKGEVVYHKEKQIKTGRNEARLNLATIDNGVYFLHFNIDGKQWWSKRLVKY
jgi:hypothetical protein